MLEAPIQLLLQTFIHYQPSLGSDLMTGFMENKDHTSHVMECNYIEEGIDLRNIVVSWEKDTSNSTLQLLNKNLRVIQDIIDGGSRVNILSRDSYKAWGLPPLEKASFIIKLTDQSHIIPMGQAQNIPIQLAGFWIVMSFIVMDMLTHSSCFLALLGSPWIRVATTLHDWRNNTL